MSRLVLTPTTIGKANKLVANWHRHHRPVQGALFAVAASIEGAVEPCGAAIIGRPVARMLQDGFTAEVTRLVTDGTPNVCSLLYGAAWRAARALGYTRLITYILQSEGGVSLKAAGWVCLGECGGGSWDTPTRRRIDKHPLEKKVKWEKRVQP